MRRRFGIFAVLFFIMFSVTVISDPNGVNDLERGVSERASDVSPIGVIAEAGNLTGLDVNGTTVSQRWQGFFGNVSGKIVLEDASGNSFYDWTLANPSGEIYAANHSSVTWNNIYCVNFSADTSEETLDADGMNLFIGYETSLQRAREDTVNATFNQTLGDSGETLTVGDTTFVNADNCSMVTTHNNNGYQTSNFREVLLTDNSSVVFASILEQDTTGFNGVTYDFQILVGVNGTDQYNTRDYFFFVELS